MVDRRPPGFNVDLAFADSKEVMAIPARYRNAAVGLWTRAGAWAAAKMTDGHVPADVLKTFGAYPALVAALIDSTLWKPSGQGSIEFTNWPKWQRTRAEIMLYRQSEAARKRTARAANSDDNETSARTSGGTPQPVRVEPADPSTKYRELREGGSSRGNSPPAPQHAATPLESFPDQCPKHRHMPDPPACHACRRQRLDNANAAQQAADVASVKLIAERDREKRRAAQCAQCRGNGWVLDDWGDPLDPAVKCQHPEVP